MPGLNVFPACAPTHHSDRIRPLPLSPPLLFRASLVQSEQRRRFSLLHCAGEAAPATQKRDSSPSGIGPFGADAISRGHTPRWSWDAREHPSPPPQPQLSATALRDSSPRQLSATALRHSSPPQLSATALCCSSPPQLSATALSATAGMPQGTPPAHLQLPKRPERGSAASRAQGAESRRGLARTIHS